METENKTGGIVARFLFKTRKYEGTVSFECEIHHKHTSTPPPTSTLPSPRASGFMRLNTWPQLVKVFERIADTLRGERSLEGGP